MFIAALLIGLAKNGKQAEHPSTKLINCEQ